MPKEKIIIFDCLRKNSACLDLLFLSLGEKGYEFAYFGQGATLIKKFRENNCGAQKSFAFWSKFGKSKQYLLLFFLPIFIVYALIKLLLLKIKLKPAKIILVGNAAKIIFTLPAKLLKLKVFWLELPGANQTEFIRPLGSAASRLSKRATVIVFNEQSKNRLIRQKWTEKNIFLLNPGLNLNKNVRQENIFHDLANSRAGLEKKFFTIGAAADLDENQNIETLLSAIKKALVVIPNLQLIIIGDGPERKNLTWLAKKIGIENLVWFVGEQAHPQKWLNNFNLFIPACLQADLKNIFILLQAMNCEVPVITAKNKDFGGIIVNNKTGLMLEIEDSDSLAAAIIRLQQNEKLAKLLKQNAKEAVRGEFNSDKMAEQLIKILN